MLFIEFWELTVLSCYVNEAYAIMHAMLCKSYCASDVRFDMWQQVRCFEKEKKEMLRACLHVYDLGCFGYQKSGSATGTRGSRTLPLRVFNSTSVYLKKHWKGNKSFVWDEVFVLNLQYTNSDCQESLGIQFKCATIL